ncbi:hypothetical protein HYFRA_00004447 [Hymenoscyphus fraxineus]|uniref:Uncharacterized protein n=1 Tax=Hymenoscyphus fraxineus TaxID=746836 RepID=A0A9N9PTH5_9HELO|nr:hypothetical protein HYFRA_00004447 [Hymenoscyphus fraxineus]
MLFNILTVATLLSAVSASPVPQMEIQPVYAFDVTRWHAGCQRECSYAFNITGNTFGQYPTIPAFSAECLGEGEGADYRKCTFNDGGSENRTLVAKLLPTTESGTGAHLKVSYGWTDSEQPNTYYNYTGTANPSYNAAAAPLANFTIIPTENFGVGGGLPPVV